MRPVYKSLALAATVLKVSLALNAQTRDDESASTMALPADLLDSLRIELVAQNVSGARNLIESGECVIDGSNLTITLDTSEWTRGAMYRVQVLATFGTQTQVIYALNITVPYYIALSDTLQEYEDTVTVVSTITDVTEADLDGLALEETSQEIKAAITPISQAAEAYNTGKEQLTANLEFKGVPASVTETLPELAAKVRDIAQTTTEIVGGEMYGAQLFGDANPAQSPLWNLYDVLAEMKTRFMGAGQYAALIVCEYYKGYDSLQLQGADAYYTCDGDLYETSMPLHVWHDNDNGKANRWVCFLFATAGARLDITNTAISPRSMYIGGHIGTIEYFVNGRLTELVCGVEETDIVDNLLNKGFSQEWGRNLIIRGIKELTKDDTTNGLVVNSNGIVYIENAYDGANVHCKNVVSCPNADSVVLKGEKTRTLYGSSSYILNIGANTKQVKFDGLKKYVTDQIAGQNNFIAGDMSGLQVLDMRDIEVIQVLSEGYGGMNIFARNANTANLADIWVGESAQGFRLWGWNPTNVLADPDKKAQLIENIKNHILARVSDATGGTQLVFTISTNMYNNIASEQIGWQGETMSLADAFLAKNWLLAGA